MDVQDKDQKLWEWLKKWQDIEPSSGYISAFWTRLPSVNPWHQKIWKNVIQSWQVKPAFFVTAFCLLILTGTVSIKNYHSGIGGAPEVIVLNLSDDEVKMLENFDLAQSYDIIKDIDFLENIELNEEVEQTGGISL